MATTIVASTDNEVKEAIQRGYRFKIAPSVTKVQVEGTKINYENVAEALENNSSVKHLVLNLDQFSPDAELEKLIEAVSSSQVLQSIVISTNSESTLATIGQLLQQNSAISILGAFCNYEIRSEEFFAGLEKSISLLRLRLHNDKWYELNIQAAQELYKRLVFSLGNNNYIKKFTITTGIISNEKVIGFKDLASEGVTSVDQLRHLEIFIEREPTPKQLIQSSSWDKLSEYIKENDHELLEERIYLPELSLGTKSIIANLAVQSLTELAEERSAQKKSREQEIQATQQQLQSLSDQIIHLKNQLIKLKSDKSVVTQKLKNQKDTMSLVLSREKLLNDQLTTFQNHVKDNEPAIKKWEKLLQTDLHEWSCENVLVLLSEMRLSTYSEIFLANKVDGAVLTTLDTNDMMTVLNLPFKSAKALQMYIYLIQTHHDIYTIPAAVLQWNYETVGTWLKDNDFGHLVDVFKKHQITGTELVFLEKIDITHHLQINSLGDTTKLLKAVSKLKDSLQSEQRKNSKDGEANNDALLEHQRQLEEMKRANETLTRTLKERETKIPEAFICPITHEIMSDPVVASDGHTYERTAIELWLKTKNTSPMTGVKLNNKRLTPSHTLKSMISEFVDASK